jgi:two-component system, chemotaxis family, chemotaxis protein CheY
MVPEQTHIVVVNDSPEFLDLMADILHDERYPVTVIDGDRENAVDLVRAAVPAALIIDLRLGRDELHGWEVIQELRRDPNLSELPTLICTGDTRALSKLETTVAGMRRVATITKPFDIDELLSKLAQLLERQPA